jgi:hypothetical protein
MNSTRFGGVLAVSSLLVVPGAGLAGAPRPEKASGPPFTSRGACEIARVFSPDVPHVSGSKLRFPAARVIGIEFEMVSSRVVPGTHTLELRLYSPEGHLYQALPARFDVVPADRVRPGPRERSRPGDHSEAEPVRVRLSVPGSPIVTHGLYGRWEARPYLDGAPEPCGKAQGFWLEADRPPGHRRRDGSER